MVVGENPKSIVEKYGSEYKTEPYVKYKYLNAKKYQDTAIKALDTMLANIDKIGLPPTTKEALENRLDTIKNYLHLNIIENLPMVCTMMKMEMRYQRKTQTLSIILVGLGEISVYH